MASHELDATDRATLLRLARASIQAGLEGAPPLSIQADDYSQALQAQRASFVTLQLHGRLRGCIGHLEPIQPLLNDVLENARAAAFNDPRFPALSAAEMAGLELHISVLTPAVPLQFGSEQELLAMLRPGIDGLILEEGNRRATFLPSVWESLSRPQDFLRQLKLKAGLGAEYWSDTLSVARYQTESFE